MQFAFKQVNSSVSHLDLDHKLLININQCVLCSVVFRWPARGSYVHNIDIRADPPRCWNHRSGRAGSWTGSVVDLGPAVCAGSQEVTVREEGSTLAAAQIVMSGYRDFGDLDDTSGTVMERMLDTEELVVNSVILARVEILLWILVAIFTLLCLLTTIIVAM